MQLTPFSTQLIDAALATADGLYVRGHDTLAQVRPDGSTSVLHHFDLQIITAYTGLVRLGESLFTLDRPVNGTDQLLELPTAGSAIRREKFRRPVGLVVVGVELLVFDALVPITQLRAVHADKTTLVAEARNLTQWLATPEALLWSDNAGIWQYRAGKVTQLLATLNIVRFTPALVSVAQHLEAGWPKLTVRLGPHGTPLPVPAPTEHPVRLHELAAGTLLQTGPRLASVAAPAADWMLPGDPDAAAGLVVAGGQLWHLVGRTQLGFSPDGQQWTTLDLPLPCSGICPDGAGGLVASGRRGAVWIKP